MPPKKNSTGHAGYTEQWQWLTLNEFRSRMRVNNVEPELIEAFIEAATKCVDDDGKERMKVRAPSVED